MPNLVKCNNSKINNSYHADAAAAAAREYLGDEDIETHGDTSGCTSAVVLLWTRSQKVDADADIVVVVVVDVAVADTLKCCKLQQLRDKCLPRCELT